MCPVRSVTYLSGRSLFHLQLLTLPLLLSILTVFSVSSVQLRAAQNQFRTSQPIPSGTSSLILS